MPEHKVYKIVTQGSETTSGSWDELERLKSEGWQEVSCDDSETWTWQRSEGPRAGSTVHCRMYKYQLVRY